MEVFSVVDIPDPENCVGAMSAQEQSIKETEAVSCRRRSWLVFIFSDRSCNKPGLGKEEPMRYPGGIRKSNFLVAHLSKLVHLFSNLMAAYE